MMNKAVKTTLGFTLLAAALFTVAPAGQASLDILGGYLIPATPFDKKVAAAGAMRSYGFARFLESVRSGDELFLQARSIRYVADLPDEDYWQTPQETQTRWSGDCEDKAIWLYAHLKMNGYFNIRLVVGRYRGVDKGYHVWVTMPDGQDGYFILDPTAQKRIWKSSDFPEGSYKPLYSFDGINRYRHDV